MGFIKAVLGVSGSIFLIGLGLLAVGTQLELVQEIKDVSKKIDSLTEPDEEVPEF